VKKASGSATTVYIFSGSKVIAEYDNGAAVGSPSREYIYSGATLLAKIDSTGTKYYHQDHLSNRVVTDSSGNTLEQLGHYPFGESWYNASNDKLLFTSYERDAESGNDYAMMRSFVNSHARFTSSDPLSGSISNPQSLNRYTYAGNDPGNLIDPEGLSPKLEEVGIDPSAWWNFWLFDVFIDASSGSLTVSDGSYTLVSADQGLWQLNNDPGAIFGLFPPGPTPQAFPLAVPPPKPPFDPIWNALAKLKKLLTNDADCLAFLNSAAIDALGRLATIMDGYYGQANMGSTRNANGTISVTNAVSFGYIGQLVTVNTSGAFFTGKIGGLPLTTDRGNIPGGTPAAQGFILLHELGHNTNVLSPDANNQSIVNTNDKQLEQHCSKTISALSH
jgi:RHS repeat-associated protein